MPATSPIDIDEDTANVTDGGDSMEHYADEMSSDKGSPALESSEVRQARTQAIALSKAAESARTRYARLASPQGSLSNADFDYGMVGDEISDPHNQIEALETALAASTVAGGLGTLDVVQANPVLKAGIPWAPLLFLKPANRGNGVGALISDPRVWSGVAVAGLAIASEVMRKKGIADVRITRFERELAVGSKAKFFADAFDDSGKVVPGQKVAFTSSRPKVAKIDEAGIVTAASKGKAEITATCDGKSDLVALRVK